MAEPGELKRLPLHNLHAAAGAKFGGFAGWYGDRAWVNGQVSYSWLDYDVTRKVHLGPATREHKGSPEGSNLTAALNAGYEFGQEGSFRHGPVAAVIWQQVKLDGYEESNPSATALGYGNQDVDSTVGRIGWQARFDGALDPSALYARLRQHNPAPFAGLFATPDWTVVSSSPERLVSVRGEVVETRPIAGPARRVLSPLPLGEG